MAKSKKPTLPVVIAEKVDEADEIFYKIKNKSNGKYDEEKHCKMLIRTMLDPKKGTMIAFCLEAGISERAFYKWVNNHPLFEEVYYYGKMLAYAQWEKDGFLLRDREVPLGTVDYSYEHWKIMGWTRFGISRNSRIKIKLNPSGNPAEHYQQILKQASEGDFTAAEFKQLMEGVNVGLNVQQNIQMQREIEELKADLEIMRGHSNVNNTIADKTTTKAH